MIKLDKKTNSLNQSGAFLQFYVLNELNKRNWSTLVETPVSVAPFNRHPETHPLLYDSLVATRRVPSEHYSQAVIESQNQAMKVETSVDIDAGKTLDLKFESYNVNFRLFVEVKKNDPRFSDWCFFQQKINTEPMRVIIKAPRNIGRVNLYNVSESSRSGNKIFVQTNQYHYWDIFKHDIADFALALQNETVKKEYYRSEKTKVDEAARQIIKGTYGLIVEKIMNQVTTGIGYTNDPDIFVPIIVTNANLFLCKYNPKDIDPKSGHIKKAPKYQKIDSIIYEYPKPKEVLFPESLSTNLNPEFRNHVLKWHVLVMSPQGFVEFLDGIDKIDMMH